MFRWYVVNTYSGHENKVKQNLEHRVVSLGQQRAVLDAHRRDLHGDAGAEARRQARADLEAEQAAAEQRVALPVVLDDLGHHVDDGLSQTF